MLTVVVTTIQPPTASLRQLAVAVASASGRLVVAGDAKGPQSFDLESADEGVSPSAKFLDLGWQLSSPFKLARKLPTGHYCRKNVGYLQAIADGATCIYETDDDNEPLPSWKLRDEHLTDAVCLSSATVAERSWVNVYRHFSQDNIWPRGLPLEQIHVPLRSESFVDAGSWYSPVVESAGIWAPIQQGLANGSPDVDAIWRLVLDRDFTFAQAPSAVLPPGQWCPFNSQSTWWWPAVYPLLYIPSYCSFRMCDIWRSFVAQRCLWELGTGIVFHSPEVKQDRNPHNLMRDFTDEISGYRDNDRIAGILADANLQSGLASVADNLRVCFKLLTREGIFPPLELELVEAWLDDLHRIDT